MAAPASLLVSLLALAIEPGEPGEPRLAVIVTAAAPVDPRRLADALRAYLDEHGIDVRRGDATAPGDLRRQLSEARRIGEAARALAVVRAAEGPSGAVEIELVDLATDKALLAEVPRPAREEDLYRTLALKIQALLRATLSEAPERLSAVPPLAGLIAQPAAAPDAPRRLALETGYALFALPLGSLALHGVGITLAFAPRPWLELTLGSAVLSSGHAGGRDAAVTATVVPLSIAARLRLALPRTELLFGPAISVAYVGVSPASSTAAVRSSRDALPAAGVDAEARLRFGAGAWMFARVAALAVLAGAGYHVDGQLLLDTSRLEVAAGAGIGVGIW